MGDVGGSARAPEFDRHIAALQKDEAIILKQTRLNREEQDADLKRRNRDKDKDKENGPTKGGGKGA